MPPITFLAAAALILGACGDVVAPTRTAGLRPGGSARTSVPGPNGTTCLDESIVKGGAIDFTQNQMTFHGYSRNNCWSGGVVAMEADLHWGLVSACSQDVPKMISGYGDNRPQYNFYENPAANSVDVYRTHPRPAGSGYLKAKMVRKHRFSHYGVGPYGSPYTEYSNNEVTELCEGPPPPAPFTALSLDSCTQAECWYSQTIWSCQNFTHSATPTGTGPFTYQWQDGTTGTSNTFQVCPYSNGENSYRDIWVVVTDVNTGVSKSRMIHWTFYNGNGGGSCPECA